MLRGHLGWWRAVEGPSCIFVPTVLPPHHPCHHHRVLLPGCHPGTLEISQVMSWYKYLMFLIHSSLRLETCKVWLGAWGRGAAAAALFGVIISSSIRTGRIYLSGLKNQLNGIKADKYFSVSPPRQTVTWTPDRGRSGTLCATRPGPPVSTTGRVYKWQVLKTQKTLPSSVHVNSFGE